MKTTCVDTQYSVNDAGRRLRIRSWDWSVTRREKFHSGKTARLFRNKKVHKTVRLYSNKKVHKYVRLYSNKKVHKYVRLHSNKKVHKCGFVRLYSKLVGQKDIT